MKCQKTIQRQKERLVERWYEEDYPGGTPRFQLNLLIKDAVVFCLLPLAAIVLYKIIESSMSGTSRPSEHRRSEVRNDGSQKNSQILNFGSHGSGSSKYGVA